MIVGAIAVGLCIVLAVAVLALARSLAHTQRVLENSSAELAQLRTDLAVVAATAREEAADGGAEPVEPLPPYLSLARPVIKARALSAGTTSAARVLRERLSNGRR